MSNLEFVYSFIPIKQAPFTCVTVFLGFLFAVYKLYNPFNPNVRKAFQITLNNFSLFNPFEPKGEHIYYI